MVVTVIGDNMATNYAKATYTEVYDFGTKAGQVTVVGIHTPTGHMPNQMLGGFFTQFRKFKYAGCKVTIVPAAQLPADPLQVSYEAGEITIDPRDMLNPVMFHGCYGDSLNAALNVAYTNTKSYPDVGFQTDSTVSVDQPFGSGNVWIDGAEDAYYAALSDPSWRKYGIQQGMRLPFMSPRVWNTATNMPILPADDGGVGSMGSYDIMLKISNQLKAAGQAGLDADEIHDGMFFNPAMEFITGIEDANNKLTASPQWMSAGTKKLGWLPTYMPQQVDANANVALISTFKRVELPKIFMGVLILPPSYKQELYFRMSIQHYFEFKDFSTSMPVADHTYYQNLPDPGASTELSIETNGTARLATSGVS